MNKKFILISIMLDLFLVYYVSAQSSGLDYNKAIDSFNKAEFARHLNFLGSDLFEGRGTGTPGGNLAAKYLALEFDKIELKPIGSNNTYYQYIPMHGSKPLPSSRFVLFSNEGDTELKLDNDYLLYQSGEQTLIPYPIQLVFVGYGIIAPEFDYNDYQSVDVEGKIVVFIDGEPNSKDKNFFDGENPTVYSSPEAKQRIAISRGAKGSILIPNPVENKYFSWDKTVKDFAFENVTLAYSVSSNFNSVINPQTAPKLFKDSQYSMHDIFEMHSANNMKSFPLQTKISFKGSFVDRDFIAPNIIGMIEGKDPELKDTYLIVSAHYDHLGIGPAVKGDSIYNGVFDNAAGVSAVLEIAKTFSKLENKPRRSIIFLLLTGEEKGLLGSKYYVDNPVVPLYKTVADINIDGVASFDKFKSIVGIGSEYSTIHDFLENTAKRFNLKVVPIPSHFIQVESFSKSDQFSFAAAGIPSVLVAEGPDYVNLGKEEGLKKMIEYATKYYHTPFDDLNLPINYDAVIEHLQVLFSLIYDISNSDVKPEWNKGTPYINVRLRSIAEQK